MDIITKTKNSNIILPIQMLDDIEYNQRIFHYVIFKGDGEPGSSTYKSTLLLLYNDKGKHIRMKINHMNVYNREDIKYKEFKNKINKLPEDAINMLYISINNPFIFFNDYIFYMEDKSIIIYDIDMKKVKTEKYEHNVFGVCFWDNYFNVTIYDKKSYRESIIYNLNFNLILKLNISGDINKIVAYDNDLIGIYQTHTNNEKKYYIYDLKKDKEYPVNGSLVKIKNGIIHTIDNIGSIILQKIKIDECHICFNELNENFALVPCGHTNVCSKCYGNNSLKKCPICDKEISMRIKIYK